MLLNLSGARARPSGNTRPDEYPAATEQTNATDMTVEVRMICHAAGRSANSAANAKTANKANACRQTACGLDGLLAR